MGTSTSRELAAGKPVPARRASGAKRGRPHKHAPGSIHALLVRLPKALYRVLRRTAVAHNMSVNDLLIDLVGQGLRRRRS